MIPSFSMVQNGQPRNNYVQQQSTPPIYGAVMRQGATQSQVQFQQMVPQRIVQQIPCFGVQQNYNNPLPVNSTNMNINLGRSNQNVFALQTNQLTTTSSQYLPQQQLQPPYPLLATNSSPALISPPRMSFVSFPPISSIHHMHPPASHINLTVNGRQQPHSQPTVTLNHVNFCPYQPPACINQQLFSPAVGWSFTSEPPTNTNRVQQQQQPILRMPTVVIRPGGTTIIRLNGYNRPGGYFGRGPSTNIGCHTSNVKNGYKAQQPRIKYNEEILADKKDECPICLEDMDSGNLIARLPCLCIFHKSCIDEWFLRKNTCPCHPDD
uniref:RING-type E3 ubiquitin transferase n=3 Tax=Meloidogyne TaxID=189290 RepID=A0A915LRD9_MELJA